MGRVGCGRRYTYVGETRGGYLDFYSGQKMKGWGRIKENHGLATKELVSRRNEVGV